MRSKPDPVDQPERTADYDCAMCIAEMLHTILSHRDSSVNIPLPPDQHHCSDEAKWRMGGGRLVSIDGSVAVMVRIWSGWNKFRQLSAFLTASGTPP